MSHCIVCGNHWVPAGVRRQICPECAYTRDFVFRMDVDTMTEAERYAEGCEMLAAMREGEDYE